MGIMGFMSISKIPSNRAMRVRTPWYSYSTAGNITEGRVGSPQAFDVGRRSGASDGQNPLQLARGFVRKMISARYDKDSSSGCSASMNVLRPNGSEGNL